MTKVSLSKSVLDSDLFRLLVKKKILKHPTSASFDLRAWVTAAAAIDPLPRRDKCLLVAAAYFGEEVSSLRSHVVKYLVAPYSRQSGTKLLAGMANQQFMTLRQKTKRASRRLIRDQGGVHFETLGQNLVHTVNGQRSNVSDALWPLAVVA